MSGFSLNSEPFTLQRDCPAIMVPAGDRITLPAGQIGYITQSLGGSFTVYVEGNLFRIAGADHDALGKPAPEALTLADDATDADVEPWCGNSCAPCLIRRSRSTWWISVWSTTSAWNTPKTATAVFTSS